MITTLFATDAAVQKANGGFFDNSSVVGTIFSDSDASLRSIVGFYFPQGQVASHRRIPRHAKILSFTVTIEVSAGKAGNDDPTGVQIQLHKSTASQDFDDDADIINRVLTTATTVYTEANIGTGPETITTADMFAGTLEAVAQEAVDQAAWGPTSAFTVLMSGGGSGGDVDLDLTQCTIEIEWALAPRIVAAGTKNAAGNLTWDFDNGTDVPAILDATATGDLLNMLTGIGVLGTALTEPTTNATWDEIVAPESSNAHRAEAHMRKRLATEAAETWTRGTGDLSQVALAIRYFDTSAALSSVIFGADMDNGIGAIDATPPTPILVGAKKWDLDVIYAILDDRAATTTSVPAGFTKIAEIITGGRNQVVVAARTVTVDGDQASVDLTFSAADQWVTGRFGIRAYLSVTVEGSQAVETDSGMSGAPWMRAGGTQAAETDTGNSGTAEQGDDVFVEGSQAVETDTGMSGAPSVDVAGTQASETDTGGDGAANTTIAGAQATETDTGNTGTPAVAAAGDQANETDTGNSGTPATAVGGTQAGETDSALSGTPTVEAEGSQAVETDTGNDGAADVAIVGEMAVETDTGNGGTPSVNAQGTQATEDDTGTPGAPAVVIAGTQAVETDTGMSGSIDQNITVDGDQASETDHGNAGAPLIAISGAQATENDTGAAGQPRVTIAGDQAIENDTGGPGTFSVTVHGTQAVETDTGLGGTATGGAVYRPPASATVVVAAPLLTGQTVVAPPARLATTIVAAPERSAEAR
jgi:hypothetical protein